MAAFNAAPLPTLGSLFDPGEAQTVGAVAPLPTLSSLFEVGTAILTALPATCTLTLRDASLRRSRRMIAETAQYALAIVDATLSDDLSGGLEAPAPLPVFASLFGNAAGVYIMPALRVQYTLTLRAATLASGISLVAAPLTYTVSVASVERDLQLTASRVQFALSIVAAGMRRTWTALGAAPLTYTLTVQNVETRYEQPGAANMAGDTVAYTVSVRDAALRTTPRLIAEPLSYTVTRNNATLNYSGDLWTDIDPSVGIWTNVPPAATTWANV